MSKYKIGYRGKYLSPKLGYATIVKIIPNVKHSLDYEFGGEVCPHCNKAISKKRTFNIDKVLVLEYDDGTIGYKGVEKDKEETIIRMPEEDFQKGCKTDFLKKIKEVDNGNSISN